MSPAIIARQPCAFTVTITNNSSSAVILNSVTLTESTESDALISGPQWPGLPIGFIPTLSGSSSLTATFTVVVASPQFAGFVPQTPASTPSSIMPSLSLSAPGNNAMAPDSFFTLNAQAVASDGSVGAASFQFVAASAIASIPPPQGGALQFQSGGDLINGLVAGVV
jgi:hypothetical protein